MNIPVLFEKKEQCCGCGACMNICPKQAISMIEDEYGFIYPVIEPSSCVGCGLCKNVCVYQKQLQRNDVIAAFAVASTNPDELKRSASGGTFTVLARQVLGNGGIVYGAAMLNESGKLTPKHVRIDNIETLSILQGSKYVQSEIGTVYRQVMRDLDAGETVLFSGTPCQCAGLKGFLSREYDNLILAEIICHGVPSKKLYQDFIAHLEQMTDGKIIMFYFRDKSRGQGMITRTVLSNGVEIVRHGKRLSYFNLFLRSLIYRINCYSCPYATRERVADITMGDYWGFHEEYPDYDENNGLTNAKGISCVLLNTEKGLRYFAQIRNKMTVMESTFAKVDRHNEQLHSPSQYHVKRDKILSLYREGGYEAVDHYFKKNFKKDIFKYRVSDMIPPKFKRLIKRLLSRIREIYS